LVVAFNLLLAGHETVSHVDDLLIGNSGLAGKLDHVKTSSRVAH